MIDTTIISPELWRKIKRAERGLDGGCAPINVQVGLDRNAVVESMSLDEIGAYKIKGKGLLHLSAGPAALINLAAMEQITGINPAANGTNKRLAMAGRVAGIALVAGLAVVMIGPFGSMVNQPPIKENTQQLYEQGVQAYDQGKREQAVKLWQQALDQKPRLRGLRLNLAWLYYEMGRINEALAQVRTLLKYYPDDKEALSALDIIKPKAGPKTESDR